MPPLTGRPPRSAAEPAKYRVLPGAAGSDRQRPSPTVFRFDEGPPPTPTRDARPSPIYAEPCDRLAAGRRQRVAGRRPSRTPPISAGYRLPRDFIAAAAEPSPPQPQPDGGGGAPAVVVTPPSTVDDAADRGGVDGPPAGARDWVEGLAAGARDGAQGSSAGIGAQGPPAGARSAAGRPTAEILGEVQGPPAAAQGEMGGPPGGVARLETASAAASARRRRRSSYENVDDVEEDSDDEDHPQQRGRRTTVSSCRTEYSPPWDADRWRFIVQAAASEAPTTATADQSVDLVCDFYTLLGDTIRYDTTRDAILTCARKLTRVSLVYRTEPTTKSGKQKKTKKQKNRICSEVSVNSPRNSWSQS